MTRLAAPGIAYRSRSNCTYGQLDENFRESHNTEIGDSDYCLDAVHVIEAGSMKHYQSGGGILDDAFTAPRLVYFAGR